MHTFNAPLSFQGVCGPSGPNPRSFEASNGALCLTRLQMGFKTLFWGAVQVGVPVVLQPGETWHAEFAFRKHHHYWPSLPFEDYGMPAPEFQGEYFDEKA